MELKVQSQPESGKDMTVPNWVPARIKAPRVVRSADGIHFDIMELAAGKVTPLFKPKNKI